MIKRQKKYVWKRTERRRGMNEDVNGNKKLFWKEVSDAKKKKQTG